jgi:serine/threonine protein kinase
MVGGSNVGVGGGELLEQQLGEFRLQSLLGSGGMAEVYRAFDPRLNRMVAVKVLPLRLRRANTMPSRSNITRAAETP